jgi:hypothetical protein
MLRAIQERDDVSESFRLRDLEDPRGGYNPSLVSSELPRGPLRTAPGLSCVSSYAARNTRIA